MPEQKILIVDDDEDLHTLYGLYLQGESFKISRAFNGKQALELIDQSRPDLIVLDMIMPIMDGEEFFITLRKERNIRDIPVIIASVNDKISPKIIELGNIHAILKKPFTIETLVSKIKEALAKKQK
jgi:DNA-binding response OmpR family regulator